MASTTQTVGIEVKVEGARQSAADLGVVDAGLKNVKATAQVRAFAGLQRDAELSTMQLAKLKAGMAYVSGTFSTLATSARAAAVPMLAVGAAVGAFSLSAFNAALRMDRLDKAFATITGSAGGARAQLAYLYDVSGRLGLNFQSTAEAAKGFFAAGKGSAIEGELRTVFEASMEASTALGLTSDQSGRILLALQQMISKGAVSAEELRQQLGEALPGAFSLFARAAGVSEAQLSKMMERGEVGLDVIVKAARLMSAEFGPAAIAAAGGAQGAVNQLTGEWERFKASVSATGAMIDGINTLTGAFKSLSEAASLRSVGGTFSEGAALAQKGLLDFQEFIAASFSERQKMVDAVKTRVVSYDPAEDIPIAKAHAAKQRQQRAVLAENMQDTHDKATSNLPDFKLLKLDTDENAALDAQKKAMQHGLLTQAEYSERSLDIQRGYAAQREALTRKLDAKPKTDQTAGPTSQLTADLARMTDVGTEGEARIAALNKQYDGFVRSLGTGNPQVRQFGDVLAYANEHLGYTPAEVAKATRSVEDEIQSLEAAQAAMRAATRPDGTIDQSRLAGLQAVAEAERAYQTDVLRGVDATAAARKRELTAQQRQIDTTREQAELVQGFYQRYGTLLDNHSTLATQAVERELALYAGLVSARELDTVRQRRLLEVSRDGWDGATRAMTDYYEDATNAGKNFESFFTNSFSGLEDALVQFAQTGKLSVSDMVNNMLADLARLAIRQSVTGPLAKGLSGVLGGLFGGGVAQPGDFDFIGPVQTRHTGGVIGQMSGQSPSAPRMLSVSQFSNLFSGAPRYHGGGTILGPGEVPLIGLTGERMLDRHDAAVFETGMRMGGGDFPQAISQTIPQAIQQTAPVINVTIHTDGQSQPEAQTQATPNGTGGVDVEIWLTQTVDKGLAGMAARGKSQFMNYIDTSRSTGGNARSLYR